MLLSLVIAQSVALLLLLKRLASGRNRRPPVEPSEHRHAGAVSVIVATLNEAARIGPCLDGLERQGSVMREAIVVDSCSTDGTDALVQAASQRDARIRLEHDAPLPEGWVGKVWALQHGLALSSGDWILGVDADTAPARGMVGGALAAALANDFDVISFSPRFVDQSASEQWLQPSMLATLVYRFGAAGVGTTPSRVMANGQCFLARRDVLLANGGYSAARASFADDVTLARHLASRGVRVGFLDGSRLYDVRSYASAAEMWREWGRSIDLKDATTPARQWFDVAFLALAQGLPVLVVAAFALMRPSGAVVRALFTINAALLTMRAMLLAPLRTSYDRTQWTYWLSPLADPLAVFRVMLSTITRRRTWRGRSYGMVEPIPPRAGGSSLRSE